MPEINEIYNRSCIDYLADPATPMFDLQIADPPFNIGQGYVGYVDNMPIAEYREFTQEWIRHCWNKLNAGCVLVAHGSVECSREMLRAAFQLGLDAFIETEICWAYNFGQCTFDNFIQTHCRAFIFRKPGNRKWNVESVLIPSKRLLMGDKRVATSRYKGMVPLGTVWGVATNEDQVVTEPIEGLPNWGRIQGNNRERRHGHPNQLPEKYESRFINAYSNPGDVVYSVFGGSGTTAIVCADSGRSCITTEISPWNCISIKTNLEKRNNERNR